MKLELDDLQECDYPVWKENPRADHAFFGLLALIEDKTKLRIATAKAKKEYALRLKELKADIKELEKLQAERDGREKEVEDEFDREIQHIHEAAADLLQVCSEPTQARRYFSLADAQELEENEFNLNLPRYVDTFDVQTEILLSKAIAELETASLASKSALTSLTELLRTNGVEL